MLRKLLSVLLCLIMLAGCGGKKEPELTNLSSIYTKLPEDNVYRIGNKDSMKALLEHGTGIIFLGFPECPWCQAYVPMLDEAVKTTNTDVMYYNIYTDKTEDAAYYDEIAAYINSQDDSILSYNNDGRLVIYMPLVLFIEGGEIVGYDHETCTEDSSKIKPEEYWTADKKAALLTKLSDLASEIAWAQYENDSQGCSMECAENAD